MVPISALYPLPLTSRPGVAQDDLRGSDGDFAAVLAVLGQEVASLDPMVPLSGGPNAALHIPVLPQPPVNEAEGDGSAQAPDVWTDGVRQDPTAYERTPDMRSAVMTAPDLLALTELAANVHGQTVVASSAVVPLMQPSAVKVAAPNPVLASEPMKPQELAAPLGGPLALTPEKHELPQTGAKTAVWASTADMVDRGEQGSAPALPQVSAWRPATDSAPMTVTGMAIETPYGAAAPSLPESAQAFADGLVAIAPFLVKHSVVATGSPLPDAPLPTMPWHPQPPFIAPAPMADFSTLPMHKLPVLQKPTEPREPETALQADPTAFGVPQNVPQTAPHFQPMREGAAILTAGVYAPPQVAPAEHQTRAPIWQTPPQTLRETAALLESAQQTVVPIPVTALGANAQGYVPPNSDMTLGQGWRVASDGRETSTETHPRLAETSINLPSTTAEALRPFASAQTVLERPFLPDSTAETRAILRQLIPATPNQDGGVEIALFPKGLGQVKLDIQQGPEGARIIVSAARPETLDLIRRHSADLVAEFRAAGMPNPIVSFAPFDAGQAAQPPQRQDSTGLLAGGGFGGSSQHAGGSSQGQPGPRQDSPLGAEQADLSSPPYRSEAVPLGSLILRL